MQKSFDVYSDPGHGWAKVPFSVLRDLGIIDKITHYSYQRNGFAFLEEDCDLSTLVIALRDRGITPKFREHVAREKYSRIRGYCHYSPEEAKARLEFENKLNNLLTSRPGT
jgi:hypothetical protein